MDFVELFLEFEPNGQVRSGSDLSSALRGLWGRSLKKVYCHQRQLDCSACSLENCTYYVLFEKQLSQAEQYHPYIISAKSTAANVIEVRLKFFGWICEHYEKLVYSLLNLDNTILLRDGQSSSLALQRILDGEQNILFAKGSSQLRGPKIVRLQYRPQAEDVLELVFKTPLRQKHNGKLMDIFVWKAFAKSVINRIRFINLHYNQGKLPIPAQIDIDGVVVLYNKTYWSEKVRMSFRQESKMSIGGLIGKVVLKGVSPEMIGVLKLARYLHAGKQCTFGNGEIGLKKCQTLASDHHIP